MYEIIVNPASRSGKGKKIWEKLEKVFIDHKVDYRVHFTLDFSKEDTTVKRLYSEYLEKGELLHLIVMGGDGTINGILQQLPAFENVQMTIVPIGSSNDLARDLNIKGSFRDIVSKIIDNPESKSIDVGNIHCENKLVRTGSMDIPDRRFIVSTGIGFDAGVCEEALHSSIKSFFNKIGLGKLTYVGIALKQLAGMKYITGELTLDSNEESIIPLERLIFIAGMNHRFEGGGFMFGPEASNSDGLLDLCVVTGVSKARVLRILPTAYKGQHFRFTGVDHYKTNKYTVRTSEPLWVHVDGEVGTKADFIEVSVNKEALRIVY